jgi:hypothetical protein
LDYDSASVNEVHVVGGTSLIIQFWEQMPTYTIAANADVEGAVMVGKLLE